MKKILSSFMSSLLIISSVFSQSLDDYISEKKGDTLVIKDYYEMNNQPNSLYQAITLDTGNVPAGRVYELKANGFYPLANIPTTIRNTIIVGEDNRILVNNDDAGSAPPLICGAYEEGINSPGGIIVAHDFTIKNCNIIPANSAGTRSLGGFAYGANTSRDLKIIIDNCLLENTFKIYLWINAVNCNVTLRNNYFVNMSGYPCWRSGGVFDCFADLDTLLVENCTHIMAQGSMYRLRYDYQFNRIIFNHNTFVNCAGYIFMNPGMQENISLTNNIFVNCNTQAFAPIRARWDVNEVDPDNLPMGLVNVYPDSADAANNTPRKFLCQDNLVYWDPSLADIDSTLNANSVDGQINWTSQMIIMNTRTDSMFKHLGPYNTTPYSYLVSDTWKNQLPTFADSKNLFTTQLANLKTFTLSTEDTTGGYTYVLPIWRLINTDSNDFLNSDWPIPVDLSYSDADLLQAGIGGFPAGDLNWFPSKKAEWLSQRDAEYEHIGDALNSGSLVAAVHNQNSLPEGFQLQQNYPNPFNPTTTIMYDLPKQSMVKIIVYDILGRRVVTLVDETKNAGRYRMLWNARQYKSGVYFYKLQTSDYSATKKLLLLK